MPIYVGNTSLNPLCTDYEFTVNDQDKVAELVSRLCLGHYIHVGNVIRALDPDYPNPNEKSLKSLISELDTTRKGDAYRDRIHGWLFQMMSWIALAEQHKHDRFLQHYPHSQPGMHGIDGIAITLKDDGSIERIILTEDKCTENPRDTIRDDVWPEFDDIEDGKKNNAIGQQIQSLFVNDPGYHKIQNDVEDEKYRQYRIGITREKYHNSQKGRAVLFKDYDSHVKGTDEERRTGATTYLGNDAAMRAWMESLRLKVMNILNNELSKLCTTPLP